MHRTCHAALAALAILTVPQLAPAGPIEWSMRADVDHARWGTEFFLGTFDHQLPDGTTEALHAYAPMPEGTLPVGSGSQNGIRLAALSKQDYRFDAAPPPDAAASNRVLFNVWVTDAASGETGHLSFDLTAWLLTALPQSTNSELVFGGEGGGTLLLGDNRYDVRLEGGDGDSGAYVSADLVVGPVAATPEPGTLALAGIGAGALGLLRARRRRV